MTRDWDYPRPSSLKKKSEPEPIKEDETGYLLYEAFKSLSAKGFDIEISTKSNKKDKEAGQLTFTLQGGKAIEIYENDPVIGSAIDVILSMTGGTLQITLEHKAQILPFRKATEI